MDENCLGRRIFRIKNYKMDEWRSVVDSFFTNLETINSNANSNEQDETVKDDDYHIVTTTLRQIIRDEYSLADIEQRLVSEQHFNHRIFEAFCGVIEKVTKMVSYDF